MQSRRYGLTGKGNHKGCPYGGRMGWWSSNRVRQYGWAVPRTAPTAQNRRWGMMGKGAGDGFPPPSLRVLAIRGNNGGERGEAMSMEL